ncbi:MAG: hypothetical protein ACRD22_05065 [Terriglobia bacterium]
MELKDFIRATLEQIVEGADLANKRISELGGIVNPTGLDLMRDGKSNMSSHAIPQDVLFDVGLTATDKSGSTEGIGVFLGSISLGKKNDSGVEQVAVTRVRFSVPLVFAPGQRLSDE